MNKCIECIKSHILMILISIWILIGLIALFYYWSTYGGVNWQVLSGFAAWVLAVGIFFTAVQIYEAKKSNNAQIAMDLFRELRNEILVETLRFIYKLNPENCVITFHSDQKRIEHVLDRLDMLSVLVKNKIVDPKLAIDAYAGAPTLRCWYVLHSFIVDIRNERKYFCYPFEGFAHFCMDYYNKRGIEVAFESDYDPVDLVKKFKDAEEEYKKETHKEKKKESRERLYPRSWDEIKKYWENQKNSKVK
jgi:hypothetical protein